MIEALPRAAFSVLAGSALLKRLASRYGLRRPESFGRRFIAGESVEEAIATARAIETDGFGVTLDLLGEGVDSIERANDATRAYISLLDAIADAGTSRNVSIKLTQLGLEVDSATAIDNLRRVLDGARTHDAFARIDMEGSGYTADTLAAFETVWRIGYRNTGVVVQSYLRRSMDDVTRMNQLGAPVRLVKGAYHEPRDVAFQKKPDVDASFIDLMKALLTKGTSPAIATHDPAMLVATKAFARERGVPAEAFEFQMLYGVRRDLQTSLRDEGYRVRVYVPFGREWFSYFMRRLGERPANVGFVVGSILKERR
jgi:proline dehydrogenase